MIDKTRYTRRDYYLGNPGVRRAGSTPTKWSKELMAEYVRCREDVEYFCSKYVKVVHLDRGLVNFVPYPYQSTMWDNFRDERFNVVLACRQSGKTLAVVGFLLHYCLFHSEQTVAVVAHKASQAREILSRFTFALENLPFWLQPGCKTLNKSRVDFDNNTSIFAEATSSGALRGRSCVSGDTKIVVCRDGEIWHESIANLLDREQSELTETENMMHIVYETRNVDDGKIYVGYHQTKDLDDGYLGSGKHLKRAVKKHGPERFERRILSTHETREEALAEEAKIVDEEFVSRPDTYNIALGGGACVLFGPDNGFFGKKHSEETKAAISEFHGGKRWNFDEISHADGRAFEGVVHAAEELGVETNSRNRVVRMCGDPNSDVWFVDPEKQSAAEATFDAWKEGVEAKPSILSEKARERFTGVPKSPDHRRKISEANRGKKKSAEWIDKINRNPEKIRKTAEKHRGMKRSDEARNRMSEAKKGMVAKNKGRGYFRSPDGTEKGYFVPGEEPSEWIRGTGPRRKS